MVVVLFIVVVIITSDYFKPHVLLVFNSNTAQSFLQASELSLLSFRNSMSLSFFYLLHLSDHHTYILHCIYKSHFVAFISIYKYTSLLFKTLAHPYYLLCVDYKILCIFINTVIYLPVFLIFHLLAGNTLSSSSTF